MANHPDLKLMPLIDIAREMGKSKQWVHNTIKRAQSKVEKRIIIRLSQKGCDPEIVRKQLVDYFSDCD